ncbi:inositol monophosphatase family protein [soil metagenome]
MQQTADFLSQAQQCLESVVRPYRRQILAAHGNVEIETKDDGTPVTRFDTELEHLMRNALTAFDSSIGFEGEELGKSGNEDTFWLLDPIDGTENFVRGLPFVRNMATLVSGNEPVFAFVYNPITDALFTASTGNGAFRNGEAIHVSERPASQAWLELSAPLHKPEVQEVVRAIRSKISALSVIRDFPMIAEGKLDGQLVYGSGGGAWDYAPRALLIREAGGRVANIGSDKYDFRNNDVLMTNSLIFDELMDAITEAI